MLKKSFTIIVMFITTCCLAIYLSGCLSNKDVDDVPSPTSITTIPNSVTGTPDTTPPAQTSAISTPTTPPNSATQTPDSKTPSQVATPTLSVPSTPTTTSKSEEQIPDTTSINQADQPKSVIIPEINTGLADGTKVKLFVSGREFDKHWGVIMGDEMLIPDYPYIFGQLKDKGGIELAGFWTMSSVNVNNKIENVEIYNSLYTIIIVEGEYSFTCNNETFLLTVPAQTIDGELHLPLISLAKAINATVEWDADAQAINFLYK